MRMNGLEMPHPKKNAMLSALSKTGNVSAAARAAEIERRTHYRWLHSDPEYADAVEIAMEEAVDVLEAVARQRAIHGSDTLLIFLLKGHRPEKYRDRYEVKHAGKMKVENQGDGFELLRDPIMCRAIDDYHYRRQMRKWEEGGRVGPEPCSPDAFPQLSDG